MTTAATAWPRVWCGGPAAPQGEPALVVQFACETRSEANVRGGFWREAKRKAAAREATTEALTLNKGIVELAETGGPWCVRLTRLSPMRLDPDNLARALKSVVDTLAAALGVDDGDARFAVAYAQAKGKPLGVRVEVWGPEALP